MKTKKASASTLAIRNKQHDKSYLKVQPLSSLKMQIGELLLCLQAPLGETEQKRYRQQLEKTLREHIDLKLNKVNYETN